MLPFDANCRSVRDDPLSSGAHGLLPVDFFKPFCLVSFSYMKVKLFAGEMPLLEICWVFLSHRDDIIVVFPSPCLSFFFFLSSFLKVARIYVICMRRFFHKLYR